MSESIQDLLALQFNTEGSSKFNPQDATTQTYINRLTTLSISDLSTTEPASLSQASTSTLRSVQALSRRSHKSVISAAESLSILSTQLPQLSEASTQLKDALPQVESKATAFAEKYRKANESTNPILIDRRNALLLARNVDRISSILELPTLLSSAISSGSSQQQQQTTTSTKIPANTTNTAVNYASALDLHTHVKRLTALYPSSPLISTIGSQSEKEMRLLTTNLITSLRSQNIKLAGAMRTIGWLRRVAPELDDQLPFSTPSSRAKRSFASSTTSDGAIGAVFLVCRLASLDSMLEALDPLRELADQETSQRLAAKPTPTSKTPRRKDSRAASSTTTTTTTLSTGPQTERYLKRYIEIFREQSFAIVSMYKSIFPGCLPVPGSHELQSTKPSSTSPDSLLLPLPSPLATFPAHLAERLFGTLKTYLPNVRDGSSRESLLTQVLYCAGSLGRLGGDFSMMLAVLEEEIGDEFEDDDEVKEGEKEAEWVNVMKKYRVQASRLELLASGVGSGKQGGRKTGITA